MDNQQKGKLVAVILAGGKGTRLSSITRNEIPKSMAIINGKPILEHTVLRLKENGISSIFMLVGYLSDQITDYFGDGSAFGVNIDYVIERQPLGSGGGLYYLKNKIKSDFLVCSGDTVFDIDVERMHGFHLRCQAQITMLTHPNAHPYDSDLVVVDGGRVTGIDKKGLPRNYFYHNNVNASFVIADNSTLQYFDIVRKINLEHDFIAHFIPQGGVFAYSSSEYIKDVGTPERFASAEKDMKDGKPQARNLKRKQKAVFLDRDGTLNKYKGFISDAADIELLDGVVDAIKLANKSDYLVIVVSNQPVIARGEATFDDVEQAFKKIETLLGAEGAFIDGYYYCPHHPDKGFEGEVDELKINCGCRKPNVGLLTRACERFNLDLSECVMVGDGNVDITTARNAGIPCIRVNTGLFEASPLAADYEADNLLDAVKIIINRAK